MALEREVETFQNHLPEWLKLHEGKFALVVGEELVGVYDEARAAYQAGIERFGNVPLLIKQVRVGDETAFFPALMLGLVDANP